MQNGSSPAKPAVFEPVPTENSKDFLWKITSEHGTVYLLGSLHMVPEGFYPLPNEIEQAFAHSKHLVLEIDESKLDPRVLQQMIRERGMYSSSDDALSQHLSKGTTAALKNYLCQSGQSPFIFDRLKPWIVSITVATMELQRQGLDANNGIDRHFLAEAKATNKDVLELESAEFQLDLMAGFSDDLQDKLLLQALLELKDVKEELQELVEAWHKGDPQSLDQVLSRTLVEHPELCPIQTKLIDERNLSMVAKIKGFLKEEQPYFVTVGAGHLVGKNGILKLLENEGYHVEQISSTSQL